MVLLSQQEFWDLFFYLKIGEAFMGRMSIVFYKEIGFSKGQIAIYSKGLGWITTVDIYFIGWNNGYESWDN